MRIAANGVVDKVSFPENCECCRSLAADFALRGSVVGSMNPTGGVGIVLNLNDPAKQPQAPPESPEDAVKEIARLKAEIEQLLRMRGGLS